MTHRPVYQILLALTACSTAAGVAQADTPSFEAQLTLPAATGPSGIASGDLTGDGVVDLAVAVHNPDLLLVYRGLGDGTFVSHGFALAPDGSGVDSVQILDYDNDGDNDLVVAHQGLNEVAFYANTGLGTFFLAQTVPTATEPMQMRSADMDHDGDTDFYLLSQNDQGVAVLTNQGSGVFTSQTVLIGHELPAVVAADLDGDLDLDLAVTRRDTVDVQILRNDAGVFSPWTTTTLGGPFEPEGIDAGDLDGDGDIDLVVTGLGDQLTLALVLTNLGNGQFIPPTFTTTGGQGSLWVRVADLDRDGDRDIVVLNSLSDSIGVIENIAAGVLAAPLVVAIDPAPHPTADPGVLEIADLNGDTMPDLMVTNTLSDTTALFINALTPPVCPADLTGSTDPNNPAYGIPDGLADANDFFYFLDRFAAGDLGVADLTGSADPNNPAFGVPDGTLDASDFFFYLALFAQGC